MIPSFITSSTKTNYKWTEGLNVKSEIIKILEENLDNKLFDISLNNMFLALFPRARATKIKINKWYLHQIQKFLHSIGNHQENEKTSY